MVSCFYNSREVTRNYCSDEDRPIESEICSNNKPCPEWKYSDWNECDVTCGSNGIQKRNVFCSESSQSLCAHIPQESLTQPCLNIQQCPVVVIEETNLKKAEWKTTQWSTCSKSCGTGGIHTRTVFCSIG